LNFLLIPTIPIRPDPRSQRAEGMGITSTVASSDIVSKRKLVGNVESVLEVNFNLTVCPARESDNPILLR